MPSGERTVGEREGRRCLCGMSGKKKQEKKKEEKKKTSIEVNLFTPAGDANQAAVNGDVSGRLLPELHVHACYKEEAQFHDFFFF